MPVDPDQSVIYPALCQQGPFQEFLHINVVEQQRKYSLSVMRVPGCIQVRWLSCAVQLKWPMTYHTRRYSKTDHLLHVQQYLLYG